MRLAHHPSWLAHETRKVVIRAASRFKLSLGTTCDICHWIGIDFVNSPIDKEIKTLITGLYPHLLCRVVSFFGAVAGLHCIAAQDAAEVTLG